MKKAKKQPVIKSEPETGEIITPKPNDTILNLILDDVLKMSPIAFLWHLRILPRSYANWLLSDARVTSRAAHLMRKNPSVKEHIHEAFYKLEKETAGLENDLPSQTNGHEI
jgi:hypothetical protein